MLNSSNNSLISVKELYLFIKSKTLFLSLLAYISAITAVVIALGETIAICATFNGYSLPLNDIEIPSFSRANCKGSTSVILSPMYKMLLLSIF